MTPTEKATAETLRSILMRQAEAIQESAAEDHVDANTDSHDAEADAAASVKFDAGTGLYDFAQKAPDGVVIAVAQAMASSVADDVRKALEGLCNQRQAPHGFPDPPWYEIEFEAGFRALGRQFPKGEF